MISKRKTIAGGCAIVCAALCVEMVCRMTSQNETSLSSDGTTTNGQTSAKTGAGDVAQKVAQASIHEVTAAPSSSPSASRHAASLSQRTTFEISNDQRTTLAVYTKIHQKVFLTDADKKEKARLLSDRDFLKSLAPLVTASTVGDYEAGEAQNAALDLLYDALAANGKDAAASVLGQVVQDNQVEDKDLPLKDRESLAGVKAEALYEWTARDPSAAGQIVKMLPGKVSQQLWQNVQARQERNLASSAAENAKK